MMQIYIKKLCVMIIFGLLMSCSSKQNMDMSKLTWHTANGYSWATLTPPQNKGTGFKQVSSKKTGINFKNHLSQKEMTQNWLLLNGSGIAAGDINDDGLVDLYFTQLDGPNVMYENLGNWKFRDITQVAGVALHDYKSTGAVLADVDGDKDLDLLVSTFSHGTSLFLNDGNGHFDRDLNNGLDSATVGGTTMTLADIESDGDLDLYVAHYREKTINNLYTPSQRSPNQVISLKNGKYTIKNRFRGHDITIINSRKGPLLRQYGTKDELYLNRGNEAGKWLGFQNIKNLKTHFLNSQGEEIGIGKNWGLTARFEDINKDGLPDLYVCNDYWTPDQFWINQGNTVFRKINPLGFRHTSFASMSEAIGDINNDGYVDLFVSDMLSPFHNRSLDQHKNVDPYPFRIGEIKNHPQYTQNMLFINRGDNTFTETANYSGVSASGWTWASVFTDVNLDSREDLLINNGYSHDVLNLDAQLYFRMQDKKNPINLKKYQNHLLQFPPLKLVNMAFKNEGNLSFSNVSNQWGFHDKDVSQGLALADLNNDGGLDMVTNRLNQTAGVYKNITWSPRIAVRLVGSSPNTQAIGARVVLQAGNMTQYKQVISGGNYLSGSDSQLMFAVNKHNMNHKMIIYWPNGNKTRIDSIRENRIYKIFEDSVASQKDSDSVLTPPKTLFKDISNRLNFSEHENSYKGQARQPSMPERLSQLGPGLAWLDYDEDGLQDLFETSGKGGQLAIFKNKGNGHFQKQSFPKIKEAKSGDQSAVIGWHANDGLHIVIGQSNYEQRSPNGPSAFHYVIQDKHIVSVENFPNSDSSTGPLAAADYDEDGTMDIFVGGRVIPSQYPKAASSKIYKNVRGHFVLDRANSALFNQVGMVTGAVFTDYNRDGWPDLLISTSWGALKLFENQHGKFSSLSKQVGLANFEGWWNGVATGDFNNDGYPDIVATNLGENSRYHIVPGHSIRMYYYDLNLNGKPEIIQANYDSTKEAYVPIRRLYYYSFPNLAYRVSTNKEYANSTLKKIIGSGFEYIPYKEINNLQSMVFISHEGKYFEARSLPIEAQLTSNFDASVGDYNNDGNEDIFLSQNFFELPPGDTRMDGGRGLLLKGDGKGNFESIPSQKSGIKVYGEQRGAALGDFNGDGRIDLSVSQSGNHTKLFLNTTEKKGITFKLKGTAGNRDAIGSSLRLTYKNGRKGPIREIQAGSGYWSQNSTDQIMGYKKSDKPVAIAVKWFNGRKQIIKLQNNKKDYIISYPE